jgi:hypothetical protein
MGLKGYRLWAVGQLDSNVQSPTATQLVPLRHGSFLNKVRDVVGGALHVESS